MCTHYPLLPLLFPQPDELFVLPGDKVNGCVLQQGSKHKEETHCHPNIDGLHVGHLEMDRKWMRRSLLTACYSSFSAAKIYNDSVGHGQLTHVCWVTAKTWGMP